MTNLKITKMTMINDNHPFIFLSQELKELCKPLEAFGIHHFTYFKQYKDGKRINLSSNPAWIQAYYNLNLCGSSLFEDPKETDLTTFNAWFGDYDLDVYRHGKMYFNTSHAITISEYQKKYTETYFFSTAPDTPEAIHYLSNNRDILYHFIMFLKDRGKSMFARAEKHKLQLDFKNDEFAKKYTDWLQNTELSKKLEESKRLFYLSTPIHHFEFNNKEFQNIKFTNRELACIQHLLNHKSATETAELMNISARTVESYLSNIKLKLNCSTKSEIIAILKGSKYFSE